MMDQIWFQLLLFQVKHCAEYYNNIKIWNKITNHTEIKEIGSND